LTQELRPDRDAIGKTAEERFQEIRRHFLDALRDAGISRSELYDRPKPGASREPTEEELVRRYAERFAVSVNEICIGIQRAFVLARESGGPGVPQNHLRFQESGGPGWPGPNTGPGLRDSARASGIRISESRTVLRDSGRSCGVVTSFRYCVPQIERRIAELREARIGAGPEFAAGSKVNWEKVKRKP